MTLVTIANADNNIYEDYFEYQNNLSVQYVFNQFAADQIGTYSGFSRREIDIQDLSKKQ